MACCQSRKGASRRRCSICWLIIGVVLLVLGVVIIEVFPIYLHREIKKSLEIYNGSNSWDTFIHPTEPIYMQYWVFNITNPEEVLSGGVPNVAQFGPFTYREDRVKVNVRLNDNATVSYREDKTYFFIRERSVAPDDVEFCTINIMQMILGKLLQPILANLSPTIRKIAVTALRVMESTQGEDTIWCVPVNELLFELSDRVFSTLEADIFALANRTEAMARDIKIPFFRDELLKFATDLLDAAADIPTEINIQNNSTSPGYNYTVFTGTDDINKITMIDLFNGDRTVPYWLSPGCRMVNGTDATQFHPNVHKANKLFVYSTDLCRSLYTVYNGSVTIKGIDLYQFTIPPILFDNGTVEPFLKGFCNPRCWPTGVQDISKCQRGAPFVMSSPHFLFADESYRHNVTGLSPDYKEHGTFLDIEPNTGLLMHADKRLQLNVEVQPIAFLSRASELPEVILPIFFVNESVVISDKDAHKFKNSVYLFTTIFTVLQWVLVSFGASTLVLITSYNIYRWRKQRRQVSTNKEMAFVSSTDDERKPLIN